MAGHLTTRKVRLAAGAMTCAVAAAGLVAGQVASSAAAVQRTSPKGWRLVKTIKKKGLFLQDVVAVPGGRAWVSGGAGPAFQASPFYVHWTGAKWASVPRPGIASQDAWGEDTSATSDSNAWIVITNSNSFDHWNGHAWTRFSFGTHDSARALAVVAVGTSRAWAFTIDFTVTPHQESVRFFNGSTWTSPQPVTSVNAQGFATVSASSAANIWTWAQDPVTFAWEALRFNGANWSVVPVPASFIPFPGSCCSGGGQMLAESAKNVWATVVSGKFAGPMVLLHWNGTKWQKVGGHRPAGELTGPIASDGHGGVWLLAAKPKAQSPGFTEFFVHYRAGRWTTAAVPASPLGHVYVSGLTLIPGTRSLWAAASVAKGSTWVAGVMLKFTQ